MIMLTPSLRASGRLVGARQGRIQALPARFQINRAVNHLDIAVERDAFQIRLGQAGPGGGGRRSVSGAGQFEDGVEDRVPRGQGARVAPGSNFFNSRRTAASNVRNPSPLLMSSVPPASKNRFSAATAVASQ